MFAYCGNNPVNYVDAIGTLPQAVEDKRVHNRVLAWLCAMNPQLSMFETCIYKNGVDFRGGIGFCDLYNTVTGEVWELKKQSANYSCTTEAALLQLSGYVNGCLRRHPDLDLKYPFTPIVSGELKFVLNGYLYHVLYWDEGNGILRYSYMKSETLERQLATVGAAALGSAFLGGGAPASIRAKAFEGYGLLPINP